jgi:hypothetical protein
MLVVGESGLGLQDRPAPSLASMGITIRDWAGPTAGRFGLGSPRPGAPP